MADEDVIILDEEEGESEQEGKKESSDSKSGIDRKKLLIFGGAGAAVLVVLIIVLVVVFSGSDETEAQNDQPAEGAQDPAQVAEKLLNEPRKPLDEPQLHQMIRKANLLYSRGDKIDALKLFKNISAYSESISSFNLGVAQMEEGSYEDALNSFQKAIDIGEDRCYSALNAAVCARHLNKPKLFEYYVNLAEAFLPDAGDDPLYAYLYSLTQYYKQNYIESLVSLEHPTTDAYPSQQSHMKARVALMYNDNLSAVTELERHIDSGDHFSLGLLYARIGEYDIALDHLVRNIEQGNDGVKDNMAMALVDIKRGALAEAAQLLKKVLRIDEAAAPDAYPIEVKLKNTLFDVNLAQERFSRHFNLGHFNAYQIIFYFSPYRVFDAEEALGYIQKGGLNIFIDELEEAKDVLIKGSTISRVNRNIAEAIQESILHRIKNTNKMLQKVLNQYPNHSILHYNLALSFAQMGDFDSAYRHFVRSYHLNSRDILSGVYAIMCAKATYRDTERLNDAIAEDIDNFIGDEIELQFILALKNFIQGNFSSGVEWLETEKPKKPLYMALDSMIAYQLDNQEAFIEKADALREQKKGDVIAEMFSLMAHHRHLSIKDFSLKTQDFFKNDEVNLDSVFYGPSIAREMYIKMGYITGTLHYVKEVLADKLLTERHHSVGILQSLALTNIYLQNFEESYVMYNKLIDEMGEKDTHTLFLASVASIGAGHHANAIALLELSKLTDPSNHEGRFALALLYQEAGNLVSASTQFARIGNTGFDSEYFDYQIIPEWKRL